MDTYNTAYNYLKNKYGVQVKGFTNKFESKLRMLPSKQQKEAIKNATDKDKDLILNPVTDQEDKIIEILLNQFYYGQAPKNELKQILISS